MFASAQLPLASSAARMHSVIRGRVPRVSLLLLPLLGVAVLVANCYPLLLPQSSKVRARSRGHVPGWMERHRQLAEEMRTACRVGIPAFDVLWFGDSITELFREEELGLPCGRPCEGMASVWDRHYGRYNCGAYGIAGDTTEHLLWRLHHGESPRSILANLTMANAHDLTTGNCTLLEQGTNDLGFAAWSAGPSDAAQAVREGANRASSGVQEVYRALRLLAPAAHIVLLGILPRGLKDKSHQSTPIIYHDQPSMFTHPITRINQQLSAFAASQQRLSFVDCGGVFLLPGGDLDPELMPDALHPSAKGMEQMLSCVDKHLLPLLNTK